MVAVLADGKWHSGQEIIESVMRNIDPAILVRSYAFKTHRSSKPRSEKPLEIRMLIAARHMVALAANQLIQNNLGFERTGKRRDWKFRYIPPS
jgi:hypothetical protein